MIIVVANHPLGSVVSRAITNTRGRHLTLIRIQFWNQAANFLTHRCGFHFHLRHKYLVSKRMSSWFVRYLPKLEMMPFQNMNCVCANFLYSCYRSWRTQSYVVHTKGVQSQCDLRMHSVPIVSLPSFHRRLQINHALILRARRAITSA